MPILADALQDAGCDSDDVWPLPGAGPHVRRCWVVDLVLGKVAGRQCDEQRFPQLTRSTGT